MNTYHNGRFEWFVVIIVIAILSSVALARYLFIAEDARILRLEILSHRLVTAANNMRAGFLVQGDFSQQNPALRMMLIEGQPVYFSAEGWPAAVTAPVTEDFRLADADCIALWNLLLQNPPTLGSSSSASRAEYSVVAGDSVCRFQLRESEAFFDYYPLEGRIIFKQG